MDPNNGRILSSDALEDLRRVDPAEAAKFTVQLSGAEEEIRKISDAVRYAAAAKARGAARAKNKAARKARRAGR